VIRQTDKKNKEKISHARVVTERFLKKLNNPSALTAEQVWKLFKGDNSGEEIPIEFIKKVCDERRVEVDTLGFEKLLLVEHEKSLKNLKNLRKDNSHFIELATRLTNVPRTDDSFKYLFELNVDKREASFVGSGYY
jgi:alanyl-tRNA synthetase